MEVYAHDVKLCALPRRARIVRGDAEDSMRLVNRLFDVLIERGARRARMERRISYQIGQERRDADDFVLMCGFLRIHVRADRDRRTVKIIDAGIVPQVQYQRERHAERGELYLSGSGRRQGE